MILTLVKEQLRTGRAAFAVAATMLAVTVGFTAFGVVYGASRTTATWYVGEVTGTRTSNSGELSITELDAIADPDNLALAMAPAVSLAELDGLLEGAREAGETATAFTNFSAWISPKAGNPEPLYVQVLWASPASWERLISEGRQPDQGEAVVDGMVAEHLGLAIGDTLTFALGTPESAACTTVTVSGIAFSTGKDIDAGPMVYLPPSAAHLAGDAAAKDRMDTGFLYRPSVVVTWSGEPSIIDIRNARFGLDPIHYPHDWLAELGTFPWVTFMVLVFGCVVVAFAHARASASTRTAWHSTVRALGVRRSQVIASAAIEAALFFAIGLAGAVVGCTAGVAAFEYWQDSLAVAPPTRPQFPLELLVFVALLGAALSLVFAGGPALAALTTSPASALKNNAPADERQLSRSVPLWPITAGFGLCWGYLIFVSKNPGYSGTWFTALAMLLGAVLLVPVSVESLRRLARAWGNALQRSSCPRHIYAGTVLAGHPRSYGAVALIPFALIAALAAHISSNAFTLGWHEVYPATEQVTSTPGFTEPLLTRVLLLGWAAFGAAPFVIAGLTVAVAVTTRVLTRTEQSAAAALGLGKTDIARAATLAASSLVGLGALLGAVVGTTITLSLMSPFYIPQTYSFPAVTLLFVLATWLVSIPALWLVASASRTRNDVTKASVNAR